MTEEERLARLRLARTSGLGEATARALIAREGSAQAALEMLPRTRRGRTFVVPPVGAVQAEVAALARLGARLVVLGDPDYPPALAALSDAPLALAVAGDVAALSARAVAIVGARNASAAGRRIAADLAHGLVEAGVVVVSGLARGIDAAAHEAALASGGLTVAAIATGLDCPYPPEHAGLQDRIAASGAVVTEAPPGTAPHRTLFPRRNRIIAGLSLGVVVVEAAERSGSLITARLAVEEGREVFAVPGSPLEPRAKGPNGLIRQGAHLVETVEDVLAALPAVPLSAPGLMPLRLQENRSAPAATAALPAAAPRTDEVGVALSALNALLSPTPVTVDELVRRCPCSPAAVAAALLELDLEGRIERLPGNRVALCTR
ncbi:DNA-processing protein DprA [Elioraea thermophila]|uniref:DNA-processing protein DprA n=1 Tax=Elioraea thermophila TaxID=2185104 RepID=UPI0018E4F04C|nr:DNA-processing protein DprA [Elioraea thermophila]